MNETPRQLTHMMAGSFALLLRWTTWWQAALLALVALAVNVTVLPRVSRQVFRPGDLDAVLRSGIAIYPLAVLALILIFPARLDIVAAAWAILAAGDGVATLAGTHLPRAPLPWNPDKSWGGWLAGTLAAAVAAVAMAHWVAAGQAAPPAAWFLVVAPIIAAVIAMLAETLPIKADDNLTVPASAALVLASLAAVDGPRMAGAWPIIVARMPLAVGVNLAFATAGYLARTVTVPGAVVGGLIGVATWLGAGGAGWLMLIVAFVIASVATRSGHRRKALLGIAEARGGRRGPANAIANTGLAACAALLMPGLAAPIAAGIVMVAALATAASDTVASEIGKAWGRTTWLPWRLTRVPAGTSGAVSVEGTLAGVVGAAALAATGAALHLVPAAAIAPITIAATLASFAEGWLAVRCEASGHLDNDTLNFLNSVMGAALALLWWTTR